MVGRRFPDEFYWFCVHNKFTTAIHVFKQFCFYTPLRCSFVRHCLIRTRWRSIWEIMPRVMRTSGTKQKRNFSFAHTSKQKCFWQNFTEVFNLHRLLCYEYGDIEAFFSLVEFFLNISSWSFLRCHVASSSKRKMSKYVPHDTWIFHLGFNTQNAKRRYDTHESAGWLMEDLFILINLFQSIAVIFFLTIPAIAKIARARHFEYTQVDTFMAQFIFST